MEGNPSGFPLQIAIKAACKAAKIEKYRKTGFPIFGSLTEKTDRREGFSAKLMRPRKITKTHCDFQPVILFTARRKAFTSVFVVNTEGAKRTVPVFRVPSFLWAR